MGKLRSREGKQLALGHMASQKQTSSRALSAATPSWALSERVEGGEEGVDLEEQGGRWGGGPWWSCGLMPGVGWRLAFRCGGDAHLSWQDRWAYLFVRECGPGSSCPALPRTF